MKVKSLSRVRPSATPWTAAFQAPPGSQASSRGEAKDSALLSSRDAGLLEPPVSHFSRVLLLAHQAPLPMGFSRQEYCSGSRHPPPGGLPGMEPMSLVPACIGRHVLHRQHRLGSPDLSLHYTETSSLCRGLCEPLCLKAPQHPSLISPLCCLDLIILYRRVC